MAASTSNLPRYNQWQAINGGDGAADVTKLAKLFEPVAANAKAKIDANLGDSVKKLRSSQAARGVLRSGVSDIPYAELVGAADASYGDVLAQLNQILGNTEAERSLIGSRTQAQSLLDSENFARQRDLALQIGKMNKPSKLSQIFQGASAFAPIVASGFGPGGALAGLFASKAAAPAASGGGSWSPYL